MEKEGGRNSGGFGLLALPVLEALNATMKKRGERKKEGKEKFLGAQKHPNPKISNLVFLKSTILSVHIQTLFPSPFFPCVKMAFFFKFIILIFYTKLCNKSAAIHLKAFRQK